MNIGKKIKDLRTNLDLTQEELATAVGTKKQTIHKYETGIITNIPASKIKALADKLGTTPAYLMGWEDEESKLVFSTTKEPPIVLSVTPHEEKIVISYREQPQMQGAVDKLLGIGDDFEGKVRVMGERDNVTRIAAFGGGTDSDDDTVKHT